MKNKIAVVRVRGKINLNYELKKTFESLNLHNKNWCVILENNPANMGMIKKVKDYVTWGNINEETLNELVKKRGEESTKNPLKIGNKNYKKFFRLNPPIKGYGRKGIKISFSKGGALGDRGEKINDLLKRMI